MKYMITWFERPQGSAAEYENAQKRILDVFRHWEFPASIHVQQFLVRLGEFGGFMVVESDEPAAIHKMTSAFPALSSRLLRSSTSRKR